MPTITSRIPNAAAIVVACLGALASTRVQARPWLDRARQLKSTISITPVAQAEPYLGNEPASAPEAEFPAAPGHAPGYAPGPGDVAVADLDLDGGETDETDWSQGDTYIVTLSQADAACPNARECPGPTLMTDLCSRMYTNFRCDSSWSSGMVGMYVPSAPAQNGIQRAVAEAAHSECPSCAGTLKILTVRDSALSGTVSIS